MSGVFQNIDPPTPSPPGAGGGHTRWMERGWGVNSSEDARHCSVLNISKYFVLPTLVHCCAVCLSSMCIVKSLYRNFFIVGFPTLYCIDKVIRKYYTYDLVAFVSFPKLNIKPFFCQSPYLSTSYREKTRSIPLSFQNLSMS